MAPPKAPLPARLIAGDFLGFNWNKVTWMAPYNNFYPITVCGGLGGRLWSSFIQYGHFHNRTGYNVVRNGFLAIPSALAAFFMIFNADWYQALASACFVLRQDVPTWAQEKYAKEMVYLSWNKPGAMAKHHYAGTVSIPGTEKLIKD
ncbi:hypothetical protein C3747_120g594c [Trypanosoma cruzi]|uniref:Uncharacterized protein n=2 Tax=Trypanosoma cruzi TaxID=5693 RepID=Q4DAN2_TRYCC|nr:hypothetical protein, conserved [Trypanosoma cruzi]EAN89578.1 hypothetical protein, conserved [Trypanosoma cruzi]PWV06075.1 hypothetical protein C3747_120g594c [Trypanosoma cruzi]RNC48276.1 hypothetical protein TcCL_NonESM01873 [Trypanosoma cruzi]|eukprot:XP_811429.1 hypothetical protein [Trypanosoma cruzi strain CL Brener]